MRCCLLLVLLLALPLAGCGDSVRPLTVPTPTSPPAADPVPPPAGRWTLTRTLMAMDGPRICTFSGQREQVGSRSEWELVIGRTDGTIQLLYGDGLDDNLLTGELAGERFTAGSGPVTLTFPGCRTRHLIGRFSAGLRQLTAREEWIYIAEDHETTMKLTFDGRQSRLLRGLHG